jgi:hypothetical protein
MFGLLRPAQDAANRRLPASYMSVYCDLCAVLSLRYGLSARPLIVHDIAALSWLLEAGRDPAVVFPRLNCVKGGTRSIPVRDRQPTDRARLAAALSCYAVGVKVRDDLADEPSWRSRALHSFYARTFAEAHHELAQLGFPLDALSSTLAHQANVERRRTSDLDVASESTGRAYAIVARQLARTTIDSQTSNGTPALAMAGTIGDRGPSTTID